MAPSDSLKMLEDIVRDAAEIGSRWSQSREDPSLDEKSAGQFASNADLEIERTIRTALTDAFPGQAIIGEELGGELHEHQSGWAIDPIDGTSNFILGLPIWGISVGFIDKGVSTIGAISLPDLGLLLSAETGGGMRVNGSPVTTVRAHPSVKLIALGENDFEPGPVTDNRAQSFRDQGFAVVRYRCAVFSLAMSALGRLGGYVEQGCGLWDIAAADLICQEAGMNVTTASIAPGRYAVDARWTVAPSD